MSVKHEGLITRKECWEALQSMKNGKSPGNDGLTKEFYKISHLLIAVLNHSYQVGQLSTSQRQAVITLIDKKRKGQKVYQELETNFFNKHRSQIGI